MKTTFFVLGGVILAAGVWLAFSGFGGSGAPAAADGSNVTVVDGTQIIEIDAKGGYWPRLTKAKANVPTVIKFKTKGTFDCSSAVTIPSLNYRTILSASGETLVNVPAQKAGSVLSGSCSMGMYGFSVEFN